jgi:uncharacterized protein YdcH (DUF465 family)
MDKITGYLGIDKIGLIAIVALIAALIGTGYLLKQSYIENGKLSYSVEQWKAANDASIAAYNELNDDIVLREAERSRLFKNVSKLKDELSRIKDETNCIDTAMPDDMRLLFITP